MAQTTTLRSYPQRENPVPGNGTSGKVSRLQVGLFRRSTGASSSEFAGRERKTRLGRKVLGRSVASVPGGGAAQPPKRSTVL